MNLTTNISFSGKVLFATLVMLMVARVSALAQYDENVVKAAYIERITRFIEWPDRNSLQSRDQIIIGVFKGDDFYNTLCEVFERISIKEHKVKVISINSPDQVNECNICYISESAKLQINSFVEKAGKSGTLLISSTKGFCKAGVHINFYVDDEKLKFEINESTMASAGFKVSYLLMQNTRIIH
jgi:hypothetical protein